MKKDKKGKSCGGGGGSKSASGGVEDAEDDMEFMLLGLRQLFYCGIVRPLPLAYDHYCQGSDFSSIQTEELLESAVERFHASKTAVDKWLVMLNKKSGSSASLLLTASMTASEGCVQLFAIGKRG
eukprot:4122620-Ditylum_brightwellii.AAC.1